ncbi:hypothetical protein H0E84_00805 [Luteimonas sp. SJ-92]|uniref:Uncharacterized protein n=1 Tax=Luteimonas salinisoli TaxID=2752307 RepID=A0A853J844_9GAMM|nr:hypothetical protein [Luteimonas salinisoli]NZA24914.1 hypothetical protein [Luteimonas salinisoli]
MKDHVGVRTVAALAGAMLAAFAAPEVGLDAVIEHAEAQRPTMDARFGESLDYELLRNDSIGGSLIRVVFVHRFEKHAVPWQFVWYRGGDGWLLNSFSFTDDLAQLLR